MKKFLIALLFLFLACPAWSAPTILDTSTYDSFGCMVRINPDTELHIFRVSTSHDNTKGSAVGQKYTISTGTWGSQYTIYSDASYDVKGGSCGIIDSHIYFFFARKSYAGGPGSGFLDIQYIQSTDLTGTSWSAGATLFTPPSASGYITTDGFNAFGNIWQSSSSPDTFYAPFYGHNAAEANWEIRLFKTTNRGVSWTDAIQVYAGATKLGESNGINIGDNRILFLARNNDGGVFQYMKSTDGGETWTAPAVTNVGAGAAVNVLGLYYDRAYDDIIIGYQDRSSSGSSKYVTNTAEKAWADPTSFSSATTLDTGYTANGYHVLDRINSSQVLMVWAKEINAGDADLAYNLVSIGTTNGQSVQIK